MILTIHTESCNTWGKTQSSILYMSRTLLIIPYLSISTYLELNYLKKTDWVWFHSSLNDVFYNDKHPGYFV